MTFRSEPLPKRRNPADSALAPRPARRRPAVRDREGANGETPPGAANPYRIPDRSPWFHVVNVSGGRSSAYMLKQVLDAHDGVLPPRCEAVFANTGRERPETLDFVAALTEQWGVPVTWTEAEAIEAAREAAGVSARALTTARGRLVRDGRVEKRKAGRGAWSYRLVGRVPESEAASPEAESEAAPGHEAEPAASPEAGGGPAVPEIPERFAATLRFLAGPSMQAAELSGMAVATALATLAKDCGYTLEPIRLTPLEAP